MTMQSQPSPDIFPIPARVRAEVFRDLGNLDSETLPLAEGLYFGNVREEGPSRYLVQRWPLRPGLCLPEGARYRAAYAKGVLSGMAPVRAALRAMGMDQNALQMPPDPETDERIQYLRVTAFKGRFRLQSFFTDRDALAALHRTVQARWQAHHVNLDSLPVNSAADDQHANDIDVGAGDAIALCAVLCGLRPDETAPLTPDQYRRLMGTSQ